MNLFFSFSNKRLINCIFKTFNIIIFLFISVGINCHFDPFITLDGLRKMKSALDAAGIKVHLMAQPLAYMTPDAEKQGFIDLPEFPFGKTYLLFS